MTDLLGQISKWDGEAFDGTRRWATDRPVFATEQSDVTMRMKCTSSFVQQTKGIGMKTTEIDAVTPALPSGTEFAKAPVVLENGKDASFKRLHEYLMPEFAVHLVEHFHRAKVVALREAGKPDLR